MWHYFFQTICFQLVFLAIYELALKRETFFKYNRLYLLLTSALSLILPFVKIAAFNTVIPSKYIAVLPEVIIGAETTANTEIQISEQVKNVSEATTVFKIEYLFYLGVILSLLFFVFKIVKLFKLISSNKIEQQNGLKIVELKSTTQAFSFFNYVFLGNQLSAKKQAQIMEHEQVHVKQWHTIDILFLELLRVVFWCNPLLYVYQKRLSDVHEYLADANVVAKQSKSEYYKNLLQEVFCVQDLSFVNTFYKPSLIKKRLIMLQKQQSKPKQLLKYALLLPVICGMLFYTSCEQDNGVSNTNDDTIAEQINALKETIELSDDVTSEEKQQILELYRQVSSKYYKDNKIIEEEATEVIHEQQYVNKNELSFAVIDQAPVYPGCESENDKKCFSQSLAKHVGNEFDTGLAEALGLSGKQRIISTFMIDENGDVVEIKVRAPHPELMKETTRVLKTIPKLKPGKHDNKAVKVAYSLPIIFNIE